MKKFFLCQGHGYSQKDITGRGSSSPGSPEEKQVEWEEEEGLMVSGYSGPEVHPLSARSWKRTEISLAEAREMVGKGVEATPEALEALRE